MEKPDPKKEDPKPQIVFTPDGEPPGDNVKDFKNLENGVVSWRDEKGTHYSRGRAEDCIHSRANCPELVKVEENKKVPMAPKDFDAALKSKDGNGPVTIGGSNGTGSGGDTLTDIGGGLFTHTVDGQPTTDFGDGTSQVKRKGGITESTLADGVKVTESSDHKSWSVANNKLKRDDEDESVSKVRDGSDKCSVSAGISNKYSCDSTYSTVEAAKITNALSQAVGSTAVGVAGGVQQAKAQEAGTQSSAYEAAAATQRMSGSIQLTTGGVNVALGAVQMYQSLSHKKDGGKLESAKVGELKYEGKAQVGGMADDGANRGQHGYVTSSNNEVAQEILDAKGNMNSNSHVKLDAVKCDPNVAGALGDHCRALIAAREDAARTKTKQFKRRVDEIAGAASGEQSAAAKAALAGGMMSLVTGATQMTSGAFNIVGANQLDEIAGRMKNIEGMQAGGGNSFTPIPLGQVTGDALAPKTQNTLNPSVTAETAAAVDDSVKSPVVGDLGAPTGGPKADGLKETGPAPGRFTAKDTPVSGGGGGGGLGGGGSTAAAAGETGDTQPKMADTRGAGSYEGGGALSAMGGGGGGGAKDPDLSGMLAQFLPKKEDDKPTNGIMDFGGRSPAGDSPVSLLDKNVNIFDRIHQTYQDKNRRGNVGG